jgi:glycosyltransferase involved in cell wall biosynthesis
MRVHIYTPSFFPRLVGMTYAAHARAQMLAELGAEVTVVTAGAEGPASAPSSPPYQVMNVAIRGSGLPWSPVGGSLDELFRFASSSRADIAISEGWYTWATSLLPRLRGAYRHIVLASHGAADKAVGTPGVARIARALTYRSLERFGLGRIMASLSAALVLSLREDHDRFSDVPALRRAGVPLYVCPNSSAYAPALAPRTLPESPLLLHVGEMSPHKNQLLGVEVLRRLPDVFRLTFAFPARTPYFARVDAAVTQAGLSGRVSYVEGHDRNALEQVFQRASCLLILSPTETQPIVAVDALCTGLPFVSTNVGCMSEMAGGLVAVTSAGELANAVGRVHGSEAGYLAFSRAALSFFRERYDRPHCLATLRSLLGALS